MWETMIDAMMKAMGFTREEFHTLVRDGLISLQEMDKRMERIEADIAQIKQWLDMTQSAEVIELQPRKDGTNGGQG